MYPHTPKMLINEAGRLKRRNAVPMNVSSVVKRQDILTTKCNFIYSPNLPLMVEIVADYSTSIINP